MAKIKNCFMDEQPDFQREVKFKGEKIATIKALTKNDKAEIERLTTTKRLVNGEIEISFNSVKTQIVRMRLALKDWEFGREINEENIGLLSEKYFNAIDTAIQKMEADFLANREGIEKN